MGIPVKLEAFEGPLDLLLHLIEKNKVNIYDIPIVEITDQYMEYIHQLPSEDLDVIYQISPEQSLRLLAEPVQPFQSTVLHPAWCSFYISRCKV